MDPKTNTRAWALRTFALALAAGLTVPACLSEGETPIGSKLGDATPSDVASGPCESGAERSCHIQLDENNGVTSCYAGVQQCDAGAWSACQDGVITNVVTPDPEAEKWQTTALTGAGDCAFNPCNPECQHFNEEVPGGWSSSGNAMAYNWQAGDVNSVPQSVLDEVHDEPCTTGADCQMNSYCFDPDSESCAHDVCETGTGLELGCGTCADTICADHPECCAKDAGGATCSHGECSEGAALADGCSDCVDAICDYDPWCCNNSWDDICVGYVASEAACSTFTCTDTCQGQACSHDVCTSGGALNDSCDPCVADVCAYDSWCCTVSWDSVCIDETSLFGSCDSVSAGGTPSCEHDPCTAGSAMTSGCMNYVADVCAADASCCSTAWTAACVALFDSLTPGGCPASWAGDWDQTCVDYVATECGAQCDTTPSGSGQCVTWNPGQTNDACAGVDLSVGVTCDDTVPVCNHGTVTANAPLTLVHVPDGSGYFADSDPPAAMSGQVTCTVTEDIEAGHCVSVSCPGLAANREIMVNPPNGNANFVAECNHLDNWGVYVPGTCGAPTCANEKIVADIKPVNMFITIDKSGSMFGARWTNSIAAFQSFFEDPSAAGIGVALEFFPQTGCYLSDLECGDPTNCSDPYVSLGLLSDQAAPTDTHEAALVDALDDFLPGGGTPALLAFQGCQTWAASYSASHPGEQQICILVTDGYPNDCGSSESAFVTAASDGLTNHGVLSYGIGIVGANQTLLNAIATAGDGEAFFVGSGNVEDDLLAALLAIKGQAVSCDIDLPGGDYNPSDAVVTFTPTSGSPVTLGEVGDQAACSGGDGWYLDDPADPSVISLCPTTCSTVQGDATGELDLEFPCQANLQPTTYTEEYEAVCPGNKTPQWQYFAWDTNTPAGTNVTFEAGFADTQAELAAASTVTLGVAEPGPPDTSLCTLGVNIAGCPINLFDKADGAPDGHRSWMKIVTTLNPDAGLTQGPTVNGFDVTYTCVDLL